jgi:hypothetical protein
LEPHIVTSSARILPEADLFTIEGNEIMKEATHDDAVSIARFLNVNKDTVWEIIKGMKYSTYSELAMAVHKAFSKGFVKSSVD